MREDVLPNGAQPPWIVLIADDDPDVHASTRMALRGVRFRGRALEFIDAYSGPQTLALLQEHPDTAIVLLDIIMEAEDAGLRAVQRIRDNGFGAVRIIVRTGFPGQAPERDVIIDYDIHDYKEKTGLSVQSLVTSLISGLRAYSDLLALEGHRRGLMSVLEAVSWFDFNAVQRYVSGMQAEFISLAQLRANYVVLVSRPSVWPGAVPVVIAFLAQERLQAAPLHFDDLPLAEAALVRSSLDQMQGVADDKGSTLFVRHQGADLVMYAAGADAFGGADEVLLEVFMRKACQAIGNQKTFSEMQADRDAVMRGMALYAQRWNDNAAVELDRVARWSSALARRLHTTLAFPDEIDERFIRDIGIAAMLHDVGNDLMEPALLRKTSIYDAHERRAMQAHVERGLRLWDANFGAAGGVGALQMVRQIIGAHHEWFDGSGYPEKCKGDAIALSARLVAVADAYVAMTSPRPHRPEMNATAARQVIADDQGRHFDPRIAQVFLEVLDNGSGA